MENLDDSADTVTQPIRAEPSHGPSDSEPKALVEVLPGMNAHQTVEDGETALVTEQPGVVAEEELPAGSARLVEGQSSPSVRPTSSDANALRAMLMRAATALAGRAATWQEDLDGPLQTVLSTSEQPGDGFDLTIRLSSDSARQESNQLMRTSAPTQCSGMPFAAVLQFCLFETIAEQDRLTQLAVVDVFMHPGHLNLNRSLQQIKDTFLVGNGDFASSLAKRLYDTPFSESDGEC